jgi:hypothetical protein
MTGMYEEGHPAGYLMALGITARATRPITSPKIACPLMCNISSFLSLCLWRSREQPQRV